MMFMQPTGIAFRTKISYKTTCYMNRNFKCKKKVLVQIATRMAATTVVAVVTVIGRRPLGDPDAPLWKPDTNSRPFRKTTVEVISNSNVFGVGFGVPGCCP